jgi:hypothetical protein
MCNQESETANYKRRDKEFYITALRLALRREAMGTETNAIDLW